jgi:translation initiation factor 4E
MASTIDLKLQNRWTVWYHRMDEMSWEKESYIKIYEFDSVVDFYKFKNSIVNYLPSFFNGYYFFMKDDILPIWEDPNNKKGGSWNIKVQKQDLFTYLDEILLSLVSNEVLMHYNHTITGISIVPKRYNAIIKIWNNNNKICLANLIHKRLNFIPSNDISYRTHVDNTNYNFPKK